jgi:gliding motility-associated-like protein
MKRLLKRTIVCIWYTLFCKCSVFAQLQISNQGGTANVIVADIIGQGLNVINPTISCPNAAYGTFTNGAQIGINDGIILSTGNLNQLGNNASFNMSTDLGNTCNDPQITSLENSAQYDCCILEFDIIPQCNEISIRFSMGSEEYPEYVSQSFNDAFGFFISGPKPTGGNYTNTNVALLNGTTICSIDNINNTTNSAYYVDNSASTNFVFDGYTTAITSVVNVVPCATYHFKLAIADATDGIYDSGVFIDFLQCTNIPTLALNPTDPSCGQNNGQIEAVVTNGFPPMTYTWNPVPPNGQGVTTATGLSAGVNYVVTVSDNYSCTNDISDNVTLQTTNAPIITNSPLVQTICSGQNSAPVTWTSNLPGTTYSWTAVGSSGLTGFSTSGTSTLPTQTILNPNASSGTVTYTVIPSLNGCDGPPVDYVITVNPSPVLTSIANQTVCAGASVSQVSFTSTPPGATFTWNNSNSSIGLSATGNGNIPSFTGLNSSNTAQVGQISVTPSLNGCIGSASTFSITINPLPVMNPIQNQVVCAGVSVPTTSFSSQPIGASYSWTNSEPNIGLASNGTGNILAFSGQNNTSNTLIGTIVVTPTLNGCVGNTANFTISINPGPTTIASSNSEICIGETLELYASDATIQNVSYLWSGPDNFTSNVQNPIIPSATLIHAGNYTVEVTANNCTSSSQVSVVVNDIPTSNASYNGPLCEGDFLQLNATTSNVSGVVYSWSHSNGFSSTEQNPIISPVNMSGAGIYTLTVSKGTCSSSSQIDVVINPVPVSIASSNSPICEGENLMLFATNSTVPGATYLWQGPGMFDSSIQNPTIPTVSVNNAGLYTVEVEANGCSSSSSVDVVISPIPVVTASSNSPICAGETLLLNAESISGASFLWSGPGFSSSLEDPTISSSLESNTGNYLVQTTLNGCVSYANVDVIINPIPVIDLSSNSPLCEGDDLDLYANSSMGATFFWIGPNDYISSEQMPSIADVTSVNGGEYYVTANLNGCSSLASLTVVVNQPPVPLITSNQPLCEGETLSLSVTNSNTNIQGSSSVVWSGPDNFNSGLTDVTIANVTENQEGAYFVTLSSNGCVASASVWVNVVGVPMVNFSPDIYEGCSPLTVIFENESIPMDGDAIWSFGDGETSQQLDQVEHVFTESGCYDVSLTYSVEGCSNSITYPQLICVFPGPVASFFIADTNINVMNPTFNFINQSTGAVTYEWDFGDWTTSDEIHPSHTYGDWPGEYLVELTVENEGGCIDKVVQVIHVKEILIFYVPNTFTPDGDGLNDVFSPIFYSGINPQEYTLLLYDRWGEIVFESHNHEVGWSGTYDGDFVQDGTYTWKIIFKDTINNKKHVYLGHVNLLR